MWQNACGVRNKIPLENKGGQGVCILMQRVCVCDAVRCVSQCETSASQTWKKGTKERNLKGIPRHAHHTAECKKPCSQSACCT